MLRPARSRPPAELAQTALRRVASARRAGWVPPAPDPHGPSVEDSGSAGPAGHRTPAWAALPPTMRGGRVGLAPRAVVGLAAVAVLAVALGAGYLWRAGGHQPVSLRPSTVAPSQPGGSPPAAGAGAARPAGVPGATSPGDVPGATPPAGSTPAGAGAVPPASVPTIPGAAPGARTAPAAVLVHVAGRVRHPGVVRLPAGARVEDALTAAGGPTGEADLTAINLARPVVDGEQVLVLAPGETPPPGHAQPGGADTPPGTPAGAGAATATGGPVNLNTAALEELDSLPGVGPVLAQRIVDWRMQNGGFRSPDELAEVSGIGDKKLADLLPLVVV